jgi:cyanophycinase-like exopeptidase
MLLRYPDQPCIGIDENAALVVFGGKARTVSGDGSAGCVVKRVVKHQKGSSEIEASPFLEKHGSIALANLLAGSF